MCEAQFAQLALEIEGFASLPRALGGLGVGILNAADDLAGGGAAVAQGARQAARGAEGASHRAIVIGENMNRVRSAAKALGALYYRAWRIEPFDAQLALRRNEAWIRKKVREGYLIYDIGIDLARDNRSPFYAMERWVLREMGVEPVPITGLQATACVYFWGIRLLHKSAQMVGEPGGDASKRVLDTVRGRFQMLGNGRSIATTIAGDCARIRGLVFQSAIRRAPNAGASVELRVSIRSILPA